MRHMITLKCTGLEYYIFRFKFRFIQVKKRYFYGTKIENDEFVSIIELFIFVISKKCTEKMY